MQELLDGGGVAAEEPGGLGDDGPAGEEWAGKVVQGFDAGAVKLVAPAEDGDDGAGVGEDAPHLFLPKPFMWRGLVLMSLGRVRAAPMIPACFGELVGGTGFRRVAQVGFEGFADSALDSVIPFAREWVRRRAVRASGTRTVIRFEGIVRHYSIFV